MKNLKIFMFGIVMASLHLTSCKKDAELQNLAPGNQKKPAETLMTAYSADKQISTTLRFRAASEEQLLKADLKDLEFTLVETPEAATEARDIAVSPTKGVEGSSGYSNTETSLLSSSEENQVSPEDAIEVDLPLLAGDKPVSIEVKSKDPNNGTISSGTEQATATLYRKFWFKSGYHKIRVTNLYSTPIWTYYYYWKYPSWYYSGFHFKQYKYGWSWYRNCNRTVGVYVYYYYYHRYRVTFYSSCS